MSSGITARRSRCASCSPGRRRADTFQVVAARSARPAPRSRCRAPRPRTRRLDLAAGDWLTPPAWPQQLSVRQLLGVWQRAGAAYGIPWQVLAAINKVESNFGRNMGPSSAGAVGWMQFMPATWLRWGIDANGDGVADPWNAEDAI